MIRARHVLFWLYIWSLQEDNAFGQQSISISDPYYSVNEFVQMTCSVNSASPPNKFAWIPPWNPSSPCSQDCAWFAFGACNKARMSVACDQPTNPTKVFLNISAAAAEDFGPADQWTCRYGDPANDVTASLPLLIVASRDCAASCTEDLDANAMTCTCQSGSGTPAPTLHWDIQPAFAGRNETIQSNSSNVDGSGYRTSTLQLFDVKNHPDDYTVKCLQSQYKGLSADEIPACRKTFKIEDAGSCISSPCQNGGRCILAGDGYKCKCPLLTIGSMCETGLSCDKTLWACIVIPIIILFLIAAIIVGIICKCRKKKCCKKNNEASDDSTLKSVENGQENKAQKNDPNEKKMDAIKALM